jgi:hypothetical protein
VRLGRRRDSLSLLVGHVVCWGCWVDEGDVMAIGIYRGL